VSPTRVRAAVLDEICYQATDLARAAAVEVAGPDGVGEHVAAQADDERVVTHLFSCLDRAYVGWRWAVTVSRASRAKTATVSEVVMLPGPEALLAPPWVPWSERVRPGDLGVGDLMPAGSDDERLVPAAVLEGDDGVLDWDDSAAWQAWEPGDDLAAALGLAAPGEELPSRPSRARVLSAIGRDTTAVRWYASEHPDPVSPADSSRPSPARSAGCSGYARTSTRLTTAVWYRSIMGAERTRRR
jgi:Protein of unknown function (DUF3027)